MGERSAAGPGGEVIAVGSRSVVRAWGEGTVAKVPRGGVPSSWIGYEAGFTEAVWRLGVPAHQPFGVTRHEGTVISLYARVEGPTMWASIQAELAGAGDPAGVTVVHGRLLAGLHATILALAPPVVLPRQADRLRCKLRQACATFDVDLAAALAELPPAATGPRLCHGDFHPGNVILSPGGPVVVDWFNAGRGHPAGDIARTSLLLGAGLDDTAQVEHLPGHTPHRLRLLHDAYLDEVCRLVGVERGLVHRWRRVEALARLAEGVAPDGLLDLWRAPARR